MIEWICDEDKKVIRAQIKRDNARFWQFHNKDRVRIKFRSWAFKNRERRIAYAKKHRREHPELHKRYAKISRLRNPEKHKRDNLEWRINNRERWLKKCRDYYQKNKARIRLRRQSNPNERLIHCCRQRINDVLKRENVTKQNTTGELIGCKVEFLRQYLEARFTPEMNWSNWGTVWEIDHIIPLASFDVTDSVQRHHAFHYTNCQPLLKPENRSKSNKLPQPHQAQMI